MYTILMKRHLKRYTSLTHYIEFLKRQPHHIQHIYAAVFAGSITIVVAMIILYVDYGFWHERYVRDDLTVASTTASVSTPIPESPGEMFSRFFGEAKGRLHSIDMPTKDMFIGKETYTNTESGVDSK